MIFVDTDTNEENFILEIEDKPTIGRTFSSTDEAYNFYNNYAKIKGFGTRIHWISRSRTTNKIIRRRYVCSKQGEKKMDKRQAGKIVSQRREVRTNCNALMEIALKSGIWTIDKFNDLHNHPLIQCPYQVLRYRSHNKFHRTNSCKSLMSKLHQTGLKPADITRVVNVVSGEREIDITPKQFSDYLRIDRKNYVGRECYEIVKHFQESSMSDGNFYFAMGLAKDGTLRSVFWADGISKTAYAQFGDVLVFYVTYRTNKFKLPFAPFVDVNHHRQSILFGAALLEDETEQTFVWLFKQFLNCMFGRPPKAIITDQDGAMGNAIKKVFPNTCHRFCSWHISKHVIEHLQAFRSKYADFHECYTKWMKSKTIDEFESGWEFLRAKYKIEKGSWLANMYSIRHHWVKVYLKEIFFAGMTTSGRSESINSFFDGYVNSNTLLNEFVSQYDKAGLSRRKKEADEDFRTVDSSVVLLSNHPIEAQFGRRYTRTIFEIFKEEWQKSIDCIHDTLSKNQNMVKYRVGKHGQDKSSWRTVEYDSYEDIKVKCTCAKFENEGILCKHILYIMRKKKLEVVPDQYIMHRWTIDAKYKLGNISLSISDPFSGDNETMLSPLALWSVKAKCNQVIDVAKDSSEDFSNFNLLLDNFLDKLNTKRKARTTTKNDSMTPLDAPSVNILQVTGSCEITMRDLPIATNKGRSKIATRQKSGVEKSIEEKKKRTRGLCGGK